MLYYQELSSEQISLVESQEQGMLANYLALRSTIVERLDKDIDRIRRAPLAFPSPLEEPEREEARGAFEKAGRAVDAFARRATSDTPWGAAKKQASDRAAPPWRGVRPAPEALSVRRRMRLLHGARRCRLAELPRPREQRSQAHRPPVRGETRRSSSGSRRGSPTMRTTS